MNSTPKPVVIVTGASSGISHGITPALIGHDCGVVGTSRAISKSKELKASAEAAISDIVDAVIYLQSATFVTGENIRVDGGVHAGR